MPLPPAPISSTPKAFVGVAPAATSPRRYAYPIVVPLPGPEALLTSQAVHRIASSAATGATAAAIDPTRSHHV